MENEYEQVVFSQQHPNQVLDVKDPRCFTITRKNAEGRRKKVVIFASGWQGSTIRNAVSGEKMNGDEVGSMNEDFYFKTSISSAENGGRDPLNLFYDSPEQYERHQFVELDAGSKAVWHDKFVTALRISGNKLYK